MQLSPRAAAALRELRRRRGALYQPHDPTPPQRAFLARAELESLYGGAAGGGKTDALLMAALQYVHVPGFSAVLLRRTYPMLTQADGLVPRSHEWLASSDAAWNGDKHQWTFPGGATLKFGHLQYEGDKYNYQGGAYQLIGFDELTQFSESQYRYLLSRARKPAAMPAPVRVRATSNPGGTGHDWVKARFVDPGDASRPFVPARLEDNPFLDRDEYRAALALLDGTTRRQLELGEWVRDTGGLIYPVPATSLIPELPAMAGLRWGLGIDLGSSERTPTTALILICWHPALPGTWVVRSEIHAGMIPSTLAERVRAIDAEVGGLELITMDEGALGKGYGGELRQRWSIPVRAAEKANKLGYRKLLRGELEQGLVLIVEPQCSGLVGEMAGLSWNEAGTDCEPNASDHHTDALLYAWRAAKAHVHDPPETRVRPGQPGYADAEEADMIRRDRLAAAKRKAQPWWT